jgi:hypothetical protein
LLDEQAAIEMAMREVVIERDDALIHAILLR